MRSCRRPTLSRTRLLVAWLSLQALRIWVDHGPARTLVGPAAHIPFAAAALEGDYAVSYRALRRVLALSEARGYEPETSQARFLLGLLMWWFEPLEDSVEEARRAHEGLIGGGDLDNAAYTYCHDLQALLECAPLWTPASATSRLGWPLCDASAAETWSSFSSRTNG